MNSITNFKSNKGITLLTLTITIVLMLILSFSVTTNTTQYFERKNLTNLETDITKLKEEIDQYYSRNKTLPVINQYTNTIMLDKDINDNENYYVIDLSKMENLDLDFGKDYYSITDTTTSISNLLDIYIINEATHTIYYPKGINAEGKIHYTTMEPSDILIQNVEI